jgi:hypothetical protein
MTLATHPRSSAADLLRLLAVWLAVIVLIQGFAAARALGTGPLHRHHDGPASTQVVLVHGHHHDGAERHQHAAAAGGAATVDLLEPGLDDASFALTAALTLMALGIVVVARMTPHRPVWRATDSWALLTHTPALPLKPPRLA